MIKLIETIDLGKEKLTENNNVWWKISHYKVPGGWIVYRDQIINNSADTSIEIVTSTSTFVADPEHTWTGFNSYYDETKIE